ncbi:MAG TPA: nucleotidyltransferase family protein [Caldilineaceae bacterium]|nr:nucleotidyltransferase family protein [Caldilineaceae bacterium]
MARADLPIAAVIAAAGRSTRMGELKQLLPWHDTTVLGAVVANLDAAGAAPVVCVVGHRQAEVEAALRGSPAILVYNPDYLQGEMLSSFQAGIRHLSGASQAEQRYLGALLALGDQPHIPISVIAQVIEQARRTPQALVIPSHAMRRGHPFYLPVAHWPELLALSLDDTLRTLVRRHEQSIVYVTVETDAILRDMDTPGDYAGLRAPGP